ncbi:MAG: NUDIX hydrolase [Clostridia bacterium]|nr:NUDIX hydrolase [Clostridia bacterium]
MKTISIIGENYFGRWDKTRAACRGIVLKDGKLLLSYETNTDTWMLPGGGLEAGESESACCVREVGEETGVLVEPSLPQLEIDEYYENCRYVSLYYFCRAVGETEIKMTEREKQAGMEPRWLSLAEALDIFSKHAGFAAENEEKRGMYLREFTALNALMDE